MMEPVGNRYVCGGVDSARGSIQPDFREAETITAAAVGPGGSLTRFGLGARPLQIRA
jgi:hypothetical protein